MGNNSPEKHSYQSLLKWTCQLLGAQRRYPFLFLSCLSVLMSLCSVCPTVFQTESSFLFWTHKGSCEGCLVLWDSPRLLLFHPHLFLISHLPLWARSLSSASPCRVVFFFFLSPILKPCWLVAWTQTPSAVIHPILSSSGAPADGGCRFMTHWLASSKNHPALHYTQKVLYPFYVKRTFSQVRFWQAWTYSCAQRHANSKYRLQQKAKTVMLSVDRASFSQTKKANCTSLAAHRLAACKVYPLFLLSRIKHENIVALEDIYESSNHLYLIMQL